MRFLLVAIIILSGVSTVASQKLSVVGGIGLGRTTTNREGSPLRLWALIHTGAYYHLNHNMAVGVEVSNEGRPISWSTDTYLDQSPSLTQHDPTSAHSNLLLAKFRYTFLQEQDIGLFAEIGVGQNKFFHRNLGFENSLVSRRNFVVTPEVGIAGKASQLTLGFLPGGRTPFLRQENNGYTQLLESVHLSVIYLKIGLVLSFLKKED
ncbi:MAG: hypothetical protein KDC99_11615 [Cyclobacteriaceae bacterium]|nr:hypothetical protein [Cyclobacteriaceae bacterium]